MVRKVLFKNKKGLVLRGLLHVPRRFETAVVFCHGFPGSAGGKTAGRIGPALEHAGFLVLRFNMSHTPSSDGKFEDKLMSKEVEDIESAINFVSHNFKFKSLILIGHSTGAIDASLYAHRDKRLSKLILTGAVSDLRNAARYDFTDEQVRDFWTKGFIVYKRPHHFVNGRKLKRAFYDEFFKLDIPKAIRRFRKPLLIIHGEKDLIPWDLEAHRLYKMANRPKRFVMIRGADHSFTNSKHWRQVVREIIRFIKK